MKKFQILIFGASTTHGAWDSKGGWVQRLRDYINKKILEENTIKAYVYNLGISGQTAQDLLKRIDTEIQPRLIYDETIIVISVGTNDSKLIAPDKKPYTSEDSFQKNIKRLIAIAKKYTAKIVFVGLLPVDESKTTPIPWSINSFYFNSQIEKYNTITKNTCQENQVVFVDLFPEFKKDTDFQYLYEGLHPNDQGHEKIFQTVLSSLQKLITL